jgi:molybdopterin molybdotransferase
MYTPADARKILDEALQPLSPQCLPLSQAHGRILASDLSAPVDLPLFDQSAMDGYAVNFDPAKPDAEPYFELIGTIKAGDTQTFILETGQCVRIFTGARVPASANVVVMQEKTELLENQVKMAPETLKIGANIRYQGSQIKTGDKALPAGTALQAGAIGFLASMGIAEAHVIPRPHVSVIATGDELQPAGTKLQPGEIYESNQAMLVAALAESGIASVQSAVLTDSEAHIRSGVEAMLSECDLLILSGGISVGDYDFVGKVLQQIGVEQLFYKVSQKPGKPLFAGRWQDKIIFALPGNPGAVLTCFYEYVLPAIRRMSGHNDMFLPAIQAKIAEPFHNKADRSLFLKASFKNGTVRILEKQGSDMLHSFAMANALVFIPEGMKIEQGELVETHLLPFATMT